MNLILKYLIIVIGLVGMVFGILSYNQNKHLSGSKKKSIIVFFISVLILLLGIFVRSNDRVKLDDRDKPLKEEVYQLSNEEEKILRKKYKDLTIEEKKIFEQLEDKYDKMEDKDKKDIKDGVERLKDERQDFED